MTDASFIADDVLVAPPPKVDEDDARRIARDGFGVDGTVDRLAGERDANFLVRAPDGSGFVLKIANPAERPAIADFQAELLLHLARTDPGLPVPRLVRTRDDAVVLPLKVRDRLTTARVVTYLEGLPLGLSARGPAQTAAVARLLARTSIALAGFDHAAAGHHLLWDVANAVRLRPLLADVANPDLGEIARRALDDFDRFVAPVLPSLPRQVVHNDFNPSNLLVDPDRNERLTGVIDFGDAVLTARVADVAVAASYHLSDTVDPVGRIAAFAAAYHDVLPLVEAEMAVLADLVRARLVATLAVASWRARRQPENARYLLRNVPAATAALAALDAAGIDGARERIRAACHGEEHG